MERETSLLWKFTDFFLQLCWQMVHKMYQKFASFAALLRINKEKKQQQLHMYHDNESHPNVAANTHFSSNEGQKQSLYINSTKWTFSIFLFLENDCRVER